MEAFDLIYNKYSTKLFSFGFKYLRSTDEAEELVQAVFLKIWENSKKLKKDTSFKSYLFTIAYNDICKLFRKRNYLKRFISSTLSDNRQLSFETENGIDYQILLDKVQQIIENLSERQKTIFLKSRMEGKTTKEIAEEMNLSPGTIDNYISESLRFIRTRLRNENFGYLLFFALFLF